VSKPVFLHLYLQFYYISVAVMFVQGTYTWYGVGYVIRIIFEVLS